MVGRVGKNMEVARYDRRLFAKRRDLELVFFWSEVLAGGFRSRTLDTSFPACSSTKNGRVVAGIMLLSTGLTGKSHATYSRHLRRNRVKYGSCGVKDHVVTSCQNRTKQCFQADDASGACLPDQLGTLSIGVGRCGDPANGCLGGGGADETSDILRDD